MQLDDEALWAAPVADFALEVRRLAPDVPWRASDVDVLEAEAADLRGTGGTDAFVDAWIAWRKGQGPRPAMPDTIPREWVDYADAAVAWRQGRTADAVAGFERLLARPEAERPTRTVWATWMLARASLRPEDFREVRALVDAGWPDRLGLAAASLGEEALWSGPHEPASAHLYLQQVATGDAGAIASLDLVARDVLHEPSEWAEDPVLRRVLTAWIVGHGGARPEPGEVERTRRWLAHVEARTDRLHDADRLALAAYQVGDVDATARWLALSDRTPLAAWLGAKLALREGRFEDAEALLAEAGAGFGDEVWHEDAWERWSVTPSCEAWGEAGVLRLADGDWIGALDAFVASDSWMDTAYVAERVLTTDELVAYVERVHPGPALPGEVDLGRVWEIDRSGVRLRYVLARRLARDGRVDKSRRYWPAEMQPWFERYAAGLRAGADPTLPPEDRGRALFDAARIARSRGLELLGTEGEPDFAVWGGDFELPIVPARFDGEHRATASELERVMHAAPEPDRRWHYRYTAAELAWDAAALLADGDPLTPEILCTAGKWHHVRDPDYAHRFWRELRRRDFAVYGWADDCAAIRRAEHSPPRRGRGPGVLAIGGVALLGSLVRLRSR